LKVAHLTPILVGFMIRAIAIADIAPAMYKLDQKFSVFSGYQADSLSNTLVWSSPCMRARKLVEHMERQLWRAFHEAHHINAPSSAARRSPAIQLTAAQMHSAPSILLNGLGVEEWRWRVYTSASDRSNCVQARTLGKAVCGLARSALSHAIWPRLRLPTQDLPMISGYKVHVVPAFCSENNAFTCDVPRRQRVRKGGRMSGRVFHAQRTG